MAILSQLSSVPAFNSGVFSGTLSPRYIDKITAQIKAQFFNMRGAFPFAEFSKVILVLLFISVGQTTDNLILIRAIEESKTIGLPSHALDLFNIMPRNKFQSFSSNVKLEFTYLNNPWIKQAETLVTSGKFRTCLEILFSYIEFNKAVSTHWTANPTLPDKRHPFEMKSFFKWFSTRVVPTAAKPFLTLYTNQKEFTMSYSNCFTFFWDFKIIPTTNAFGQTLDFFDWNLFNNAPYTFSPLTPMLLELEVAELVRWYFDGKSKLRVLSPIPPTPSMRGNRPGSPVPPPPSPGPNNPGVLPPATPPAPSSPNPVANSISNRISVLQEFVNRRNSSFEYSQLISLINGLINLVEQFNTENVLDSSQTITV